MTASGMPQPTWQLDRMALALSAGLVYWLLRQQTMYLLDGNLLLDNMSRGLIGPGQHLIQRAGMTMAYQIGSGLGWTPQQFGWGFSCVGTALGIWLAHRLCVQLHLSRTRSALISACVAVTPPVLFFATVIEVHGAYLPFAHLVWLAALRVRQKPSLTGSLWLGLVNALAFTMHASAIALPAFWLPWLLGQAGALRTRWRPPAIAAAVMVFGIAAYSLAVANHMGMPTDQASLTTLLVHQVSHSGSAPGQLIAEWFLPYLPLSVAWPIAILCWRNPAQPKVPTPALVIALVGYALLCSWVLLLEPERGAYLTPLALPLAIAVGQRGAPWFLMACIGLSAAWSYHAVAEHDVLGERQTAFATGARAAAAEQPPFLLVHDEIEFAACVLAQPPIAHWRCKHAAFIDPDLFLSHLQLFLPALNNLGAKDHAILISASTWQWLEAGGVSLGPAIVSQLRKQRLEPVTAGEFVGYRIEPR